jgi:multiple sugar transport system permease protein
MAIAAARTTDTRSRRSANAARRRFGLLLTAPAFAAYAVLILYPFLNSVRLAFYRSTLTAPEPVFRGLDNFARLASDPVYFESWLRTLVFVGAATTLTVLLGLVWAIVLNQQFRGAKLLRSLTLLPWVMPSTVTALLWAWLLNGQYGILNALLLRTGVLDEPIAWLSTGVGAMVAVVLAKTWLSTALAMTFFLASLQTLPMDHVEAARLDGASNLQVMRYIMLPHVRNTLVVVAVLQAMGNLQQIDVIYAMTGGGPARATSVMSIEVYKSAFQSWNLGLASAIGVVWFLTISIPAGIYLRTLFRT